MRSFLQWLHASNWHFIATAAIVFGVPMYLIVWAVSGDSSFFGSVVDVLMCAGVGLFWGWGMWELLGKQNARRLFGQNDAPTKT
jgi:hypothetical protein